jgi:RNA-directed DNA polymerase
MRRKNRLTDDRSTTVGSKTHTIFDLRANLGRKAKQEPKFRFYSLYAHIFRADTLEESYRRVKQNRGSPGIDGISFEDIEGSAQGATGFLEALRVSLKEKTYRPSPLLRVNIDKPNGGTRPLSIPTIQDRVAQMACLLILEPIFEADFKDCSYGFRPERSAHDAIREIQTNLGAGFTEVMDADIVGFFDNIDHAKLMECLQRRIADRSVPRLIRYWLCCPAVEVNQQIGKKYYQYPKKGTPQGGVISPLLANIYLHEMDKRLHGPQGALRKNTARLIRYADDFVIQARHIGTSIPRLVKNTLDKLGLRLHPEKTRTINLKQDGASFDFLGYTFRFDRDKFGRDKKYLNIVPSKKSVGRVNDKIRALTRSGNKLPLEEVILQANKVLIGWGNYFKLGYPKVAFNDVNYYILHCFIRFMKNRSQRHARHRSDESWYKYFRRKGLHAL